MGGFYHRTPPGFDPVEAKIDEELERRAFERDDSLPAFERENRYIVIKRKHLSPVEQQLLIASLAENYGVEPIDCVVVERDWPEYEPVWKMIEERCHG